MSYTCENIRDQFTSLGINLNRNTGKVKQFTVDKKTTKCNSCSFLKTGRKIIISQSSNPQIEMETCELDMGAIIWIIVSVMVVFFIICIVVAHKKHHKDLMRNSTSSNPVQQNQSSNKASWQEWHLPWNVRGTMPWPSTHMKLSDPTLSSKREREWGRRMTWRMNCTGLFIKERHMVLWKHQMTLSIRRMKRLQL